MFIRIIRLLEWIRVINCCRVISRWYQTVYYLIPYYFPPYFLAVQPTPLPQLVVPPPPAPVPCFSLSENTHSSL